MTLDHAAGTVNHVGCIVERRIDNLETLMTVTFWAIINIVFFLALAVGLSFVFINAFKNADRRREEHVTAPATHTSVTTV